MVTNITEEPGSSACAYQGYQPRKLVFNLYSFINLKLKQDSLITKLLSICTSISEDIVRICTI